VVSEGLATVFVFRRFPLFIGAQGCGGPHFASFFKKFQMDFPGHPGIMARLCPCGRRAIGCRGMADGVGAATRVGRVAKCHLCLAI
jgi:hypothetical protein